MHDEVPSVNRVLVTGAAGFIGSSVARAFLARGCRVVTIDNLSTGFRDNVPSGVEFIEGDCSDRATVERVSGPIDAVLHVAGQSSGEISFEDPIRDLQWNVQSTLATLARAAALGCRRFVYASSMSVYGDQPDSPVREGADCRPNSFYGVGKLASEHDLRVWQREYGMETVALRLFNVYGAGQNMGNMRQGMVSIFLAQLLREGAIHVKGSLDRFRDFVHVSDVTEAFVRAVECDASRPLVINIGTGVRTTVRDLITEMLAADGSAAPLRSEGSTQGDAHGLYGDVGLAERVLGWRARVGLREGISGMVRWARTASTG
jgi:UDP-glucose 4-epimerase